MALNEQQAMQLRELWQQGLSYTNIARELDVTAGVVAGFCWRAGLRRQPTRRIKKEPPMAFKDLPEENVPSSVGVMGLSANLCRWPIGHDAEGMTTFCGQLRDYPSPYCANHRKRGSTGLGRPLTK